MIQTRPSHLPRVTRPAAGRLLHRLHDRPTALNAALGPSNNNGRLSILFPCLCGCPCTLGVRTFQNLVDEGRCAVCRVGDLPESNARPSST